MPTEAQIESTAAALRQRYGVPERGPVRPVLDGLVGTILSQHTTGPTAKQAEQTLRERFPHWEDLPAADPAALADAIRVAGLAETRAARLQHIVAQAIESFGEASLESLRERTDAEVASFLTSLPGVGPKTAACVLLFAMGCDIFPVDTHVWRIAKRLGWIPDSFDRNETYAALGERVPPPLRHELHVNLVRHGRAICRARRPLCDECPLAEKCPSRS